MEKYNPNTLVIFCESEEEKAGAIDFFHKKFNLLYHKHITYPTKNWINYPYVTKSDSHDYIYGKNKTTINDLKNKIIIPFKQLNFKIYKPKWKDVWKNEN